MTTIFDFISDQALLGPHFAGPSWDRWRAVLRAAFSLPMSERDLTLFREVAGDRAPPRKPVRELVCAVGRGGGKDSIAAGLAAYIAATGDFSRLRPGERGTVLTLAVDRPQASIAFNYVRGFFKQVPLLAALVDRIGDDSIDLKTGAEIIVGTNSMRSVRGRTIACVIYDEAAFWRDDSYVNPDTEVDAAISPGLMRFPGSLKILISSVHRRSGLLYDRYATYFGRDDDDVLVVLGESLQFNETLDRSEIDRQLAADYERASAEYLSKWRDDLTNFLDRELVEAATDFGVVVRPPQPGIRYVSFCDPSGGRGDSFACAIAHAEGTAVIVDLLYERRAPFDPSSVVLDIANLHRSYGLRETTGDRYAASWTTEGFAKEGITYRSSERDKSAIFIDTLPLFASARIRILDEPRLRNQLIALERRTTRTGRDIVSHPDHQNAHDDIANAMAGAATLAASDAAPSLWRPADLLANDVPLSWPHLVLYTFASAAADMGGLAVFYWARALPTRDGTPGPAVLIDYDLALPMTPALFPSIRDRLHELAGIGRARVGPLFTTGPLAAQARVACEPEALERLSRGDIAGARRAELMVDACASDLLADRDALAQAAAVAIGLGRIKVAAPAHEKSKRSPLPLFAFRPGAPAEAATDGALVGIGVTVDRRALLSLQT